MQFDTIILGGGPAGLTAGIYLARAKKKVLIVDTATIGGQMVFTHAIANYPGVPEKSGYEIANIMKQQAKDFGCQIEANCELTDFDLTSDLKMVEIDEDEKFYAKTIVLATGGTPRTIGLESETKFKGKGISYCATCDGDFFQDKEIMVLGGGNSALEEAVSLTEYASKITIVHQFDNFQASTHAIEEAKNNPKISFIMENEVQEFLGDENLIGAKLMNMKTKEYSTINCSGAFIFIGYKPNIESFKNIIKLNSHDEIIIDETFMTNIPNVFAAGDVIEKRFRQITTAVSDGTNVALNIIDALSK